MTASPPVPDQARLPAFRLLLGVQVLATIVFGLVPLLLPEVFALVTGYSGDDPLVYRLAGAATTGYLVAALVALAWRSDWADLRIPLVATFTFTAAAAIASLATLISGDRQWVVIVVFLAATAFAVIAGYWLRRDEGMAGPAGDPLTMPSRVIVALATVSAAVFGLLPLLAIDLFVDLFGLDGTDAWIYRMAGAACFGYATAGVLSLMAPGFERFRVQNLAAITFNGTAAAASWVALAKGEGGTLAPVVAGAATAFAIGLAWVGMRSARP